MPRASLEALVGIGAEAGRRAYDSFRGDYAIWEKARGEKVCDVDIATDVFLREALGDLDPDAGYLTEEAIDDRLRLDCDRVWVVDPVDGTRDFIRGREGWCVSIALVENGQPVLGILEAPARAERWTAEAGKGAHRNGERIAVSERNELIGARVPAQHLPKADRDLVSVAQPNSIALRIAMVAAGEADLVATMRWGHEWDVAAATLIAREAGATTSDALGQELRFNTRRGEAFGVLITAPGIHRAACARLIGRAQAAARR